MENHELQQIVIELIALKQEDGYWDFKREWYKDNADLLHDIICMANNLVNRDCYIIIGVDEENDFSFANISEDPNRKTTQNIVDFLREKKFAGGIRPTVYVQPLIFSNIMIDIIIIKNDYNTPYYLMDKYRGVNANSIYVRLMDTNTPKTTSADRNNVEYLWRKYFHLDSDPLERILFYLLKPEDWLPCFTEYSFSEYYRYSPEYTINANLDNSRNGYEFYLFCQADSMPHWHDITIRFHQTIIASLDGIALDGGRYFTAAPNTSFIHKNDITISYPYFVKVSLEYIVHQYYYRNRNSEEQLSHELFINCVLLFESTREKKEFEQYALQNIDRVNLLYDKESISFFPESDEDFIKKMKQDYKNALGLKQLLKEFRMNI